MAHSSTSGNSILQPTHSENNFSLLLLFKQTSVDVKCLVGKIGHLNKPSLLTTISLFFLLYFLAMFYPNRSLISPLASGQDKSPGSLTLFKLIISVLTKQFKLFANF